MCCLVCVCFVQAVCSVAKEREDVEMRDPGALSTSCGDGTGLGCPRTAIFQFTCGDVPGRRSRAGRTSKKRRKKQITVNTFPWSQRKIMHLQTRRRWISAASVK